MKISVLIIAHNEERYIGRCIESVLDQALPANEVIVVVHNSNDNTEFIARTYPVTVVPYQGPVGIVYARLEGLNHITGDIIVCTDGDARVQRNWIEEMTVKLQDENVLTGSWIKFKGTMFGFFANTFNKIMCVTGMHPAGWIWGSSFAFWGKDKELIRGIYWKSVRLSKLLMLSRNPEDYWLALFMSREGGLAVTNDTHVTVEEKEKNTITAWKRNRENVGNSARMRAYFSAHKKHDLGK